MPICNANSFNDSTKKHYEDIFLRYVIKLWNLQSTKNKMKAESFQ